MLLKKLHQCLQLHNFRSGIKLEEKNYPDKPLLNVAVAKASNGAVEIFGLEYVTQRSSCRGTATKNPGAKK